MKWWPPPLPEGRIWTLPNLLAVSRLALLPFVVHSLRIQAPFWTLFWAVLLVLTDALDGFLARRWNQVSDLGKVLDHVVDKVVILTLTAVMIRTHGLPGWTLPLILFRELATVLVALYIYLTHRVMGQSSKLGRLTGLCMGGTFLAYLFGWSYRLQVLYGTLGVAALASLNYLKIYKVYTPLVRWLARRPTTPKTTSKTRE